MKKNECEISTWGSELGLMCHPYNHMFYMESLQIGVKAVRVF